MDAVNNIKSLALCCVFNLGFAGIVPVQLQWESKSNPVDQRELNPRLGWQVDAANSTKRGQFQNACLVQVVSTPQILTANTGDLWDTRLVLACQTVQIGHNASPLASPQVCYWHVQAQANNGQASGWIPQASCSMGLLSQSDWTAQWIGHDDAPGRG